MIISIDGAAGTGKTTVGKIVANKLNYQFLDSGKIYRAYTLKMIKKNIFNQDKSFHEAGLELAKNNSMELNSLSNIDLDLCEKEASDSLKEFDRMNRETEISFEEFINSYNAKI